MKWIWKSVFAVWKRYGGFFYNDTCRLYVADVEVKVDCWQLAWKSSTIMAKLFVFHDKNQTKKDCFYRCWTGCFHQPCKLTFFRFGSVCGERNIFFVRFHFQFCLSRQVLQTRANLCLQSGLHVASMHHDNFLVCWHLKRCRTKSYQKFARFCTSLQSSWVHRQHHAE